MTRKYMRSRLLEKATLARTYAPRRVLDVAAEVASRFIASCGGKPGMAARCRQVLLRMSEPY
jgi:hypothetical protein